MKSQQGAGIKMDTDGTVICLEKAAAGGGCIFAPAEPIPPGVPADNAVALIDRFVNQKDGG
jgi:hypothetical protein